jgi:hypothetical protein
VFDPSSKSRLTPHDLERFPSDTLFDKIGRVVCGAACLPRKELFEAWEVARRVRRRFRGGRIVDLCAGHGLLGHLMLLLDDSSSEVRLVDPHLPPSSDVLHRAMLAAWPRLDGRVFFEPRAISDVVVCADDVVVSVHACGGLTDQVIGAAVEARARLAVMPCCHDLDASDTGSLTGWLDGPVAVDVVRAAHLRARGWNVWTQLIPAAITPHNRLLLAAPPAATAVGSLPLD